MGLVPRLEASVNDKINDNEHARSGNAATPVMSEDTRLHVILNPTSCTLKQAVIILIPPARSSAIGRER
jgi:hypothetical protein